MLLREHVRSGGWRPGKDAISDNVLERLAWPELWGVTPQHCPISRLGSWPQVPVFGEGPLMEEMKSQALFPTLRVQTEQLQKPKNRP